MFRMAKLTDYGILLLTEFARNAHGNARTARELALDTRLPLPTVGKILKTLVHQGLLVSHRGIRGGYQLARRPEEISVADIITALEGPVAITECNSPTPGICEHEEDCSLRANWSLINRSVTAALETVTLAQMAKPFVPRLWPLTSGISLAPASAGSTAP